VAPTAAKNGTESGNAVITVSYILIYMSALCTREQRKERGTYQVPAPAVSDGVAECREDGLDACQRERARVERSECTGEERERRAASGNCWVRMAHICINVGVGIQIEVGAERRR
jgi:hypothetical protein